MGQKDQIQKHLRKLGYNSVNIPRADLVPLKVLGQRRRSVSLLGDLRSLLTEPPQDGPPVTEDLLFQDLAGASSDSMSGKAGASLAKGMLQAVGFPVSADVLLRHEKSLTFTFKDVRGDASQPLDVAEYLGRSTPALSNSIIRSFADPQASDVLKYGRPSLYVVTEVLRCVELEVEASGVNEGDVSGELLGENGASASVVASGSNSVKLGWVAEHPLAFAFRCHRLTLRDGQWVVSIERDDSPVSLGEEDDEPLGELLFDEEDDEGVALSPVEQLPVPG
ncbi:MAG: hypothetical protein H6739_26700 [Alphaproteobacteria bacterium]|nr:hypothetical protein [Alphaproteobacteria bacterium]